ncbi:MAG: hemerythrin family protein [Desulfobulbus sp.]|nr:hemerythrin family protein [Desulfobulbus sp.]
MSSLLQWDSRLSVGNETLDAQHRNLLAQCKTLADCLAGNDADEFHRLFATLIAASREHFAAEEALLAQSGYPEADLEAHLDERDEFNYLADQIITAENFDPQELQDFLSLWWSGHILGSAKKQRDFLERAAG